MAKDEANEIRKLWRAHNQVIKEFYDLRADDCVHVAGMEIEYHYVVKGEGATKEPVDFQRTAGVVST